MKRAPPSGEASARGGAAMQFEHAAGDRQAEAVAAGGAVARTVEPGEGGEDVFAVFRRDADAVVVNMDQDAPVAAIRR